MSIIQSRLIDGRNNLIPIIMIHTTPLDGVYLHNSLSKFNRKSMQCQIHIIDLPSHGLSSRVEHNKLNFENMADEIEGYRKDQKIQQFHIFGHGVGGFIALHYATKYHKYIKSVIISNTAINSSYREKMAWNIRNKFSNETKNIFDQFSGNVDAQSLKIRFTKSLATHFHPASLEKAQNLIEDADMFASEAYVMISYYEIPKYNMRGKARSIKQPVLILGGAYDVWPVEAVKKIKQELRQAKLHFFPTGHFPMLEDPDNYWKVIFDWLDQQME